MGVITNNGPIDNAGATKAAHFIQACCQSRTPILYLQNTTGFMVGRAHEEGGMIKHGSKMIQAVTQRDRAADHHLLRRFVRRWQLRHVRARLSSALLLRGPTRAPR